MKKEKEKVLDYRYCIVGGDRIFVLKDSKEQKFLQSLGFPINSILERDRKKPCLSDIASIDKIIKKLASVEFFKYSKTSAVDSKYAKGRIIWKQYSFESIPFISFFYLHNKETIVPTKLKSKKAKIFYVPPSLEKACLPLCYSLSNLNETRVLKAMFRRMYEGEPYPIHPVIDYIDKYFEVKRGMCDPDYRLDIPKKKVELILRKEFDQESIKFYSLKEEENQTIIFFDPVKFKSVYE